MFRPTPRKTPAPSAHPRRAFTLIELLAVIAIIGVLAAIIIGSVSKVRDAARSATCSSNLRQIGAAFNLYAADNRGLYPAPRFTYPAPDDSPNPNLNKDNWQGDLNRYVLTDQLITVGGVQKVGGDITQTKKIGANQNIAHCPSFDLLFPSITNLSASNYRTAGYGMNTNLNIGGKTSTGSPIAIGGSKLSVSTRFPSSLIVNPAKSVLVADSSDYHIGVSGSWTRTANTDPSSNMGKPDGYESGAPYRHGNSANYLFADGHVAALSPDAALPILRFIP
jgi:prepilin-type N-terminal cleavage/methylation domain-containing protein/prepilin-type processing-associated H-X9-DG protein